MNNLAISQLVKKHLFEDGLETHAFYFESLPGELVNLQLKIKEPMVLCGMPYFAEVFKQLGSEVKYPLNLEGKQFETPEVIDLGDLPFNVCLSAERLALNYLQIASSIASYTKNFVKRVGDQFTILDTRKTTPGLRSLEKYATLIGGAQNHRFEQTDLWMIKDNHKNYFGGLRGAVDFFVGQKQFYKPIICEIHSLEELKIASDLNIKHFMLDNFSPEEIRQAIAYKKEHWTYEVSGGLKLENIKEYCIEGVDALSVGALTYSAPAVDLSLKYYK